MLEFKPERDFANKSQVQNSNAGKDSNYQTSFDARENLHKPAKVYREFSATKDNENIDTLMQRRISQLELRTTVLPLSENKMFSNLVSEIVKGKTESKLLLKYNVHKVLFEIFDKVRANLPDVLLLLDAVQKLSEVVDDNSKLAIQGHFLQEGYITILSSIRLILKKDASKKIPDDEIGMMYSSAFILSPLTDDELTMLDKWVSIFSLFFMNKDVVDYYLKCKYDMMNAILSFVDKCESAGFTAPKERLIGIKMNFYKLLETCMNKKILAENFLANEVQAYWFFLLVRDKPDFDEHLKLYEILIIFAGTEYFPLNLKKIHCTRTFVLNRIPMVIYDKFRGEREHTWWSGNIQQEKLFTAKLSQVLYLLVSRPFFRKEILHIITKSKEDFILRLFLHSIAKRDYKSVVYQYLVLIQLLNTERFPMPPFAANIGILLVCNTVAQDDFLTILALRIVKYIEFADRELATLINLLITPNIEHAKSFKIEPLDQDLLDQYIHRFDPMMVNSRFYQEVRNGQEVQGLVLSEHEELSEIEKDSRALNSLELESSGEYDEENDIRDFAENWLRIKEEGLEKDTKKEGSANTPEENVFNFKLEKRQKTFAHKYLFRNAEDQDFKFIRHCEGACQFCTLFKGIHSISENELKELLLSNLAKGQEPELNQYDLTMSIFECVFDLTFGKSIVFIFQNIIPNFCRFLVAKKVEPKNRIPVYLYFTHLIVNLKKSVNAFSGIQFFLYTEQKMLQFIQNFDLKSYGNTNDKFSQKEIRDVPRKIQVKKTIQITREQWEAEQELAHPELKNKKKKKPKKMKKGELPEMVDKEITVEQTVYDKKEITVHTDIVWGDAESSFVRDTLDQDEELQEFLIREREDALTDEGRYTKYFWKLHTFYHLMRINYEVIKKSSKNFQNVMDQQLDNIILNIIELSVIFSKFYDRVLPSEPFHPDTDCWPEIRSLMSETLAVLHEMNFVLISKFSKFKNQFGNYLIKNEYYLYIVMNLLGNLPSLQSSAALTSSLFLFLSDEQRMNEPIRYQEALFLGFFESASKELNRVNAGSANLIGENEKRLNSNTFYNRPAILNILRLACSCLQIFNVFVLKRNLDPNIVETPVFETLVRALFPITKLAHLIDMKFKKLCGIESQKGDGNSTNRVGALDIDQLMKKLKKEDEPLLIYQTFFSILSVFLFIFTKKEIHSQIVIKNEVYRFLFEKYQELHLPAEAVFSFMGTTLNITQNIKKLFLIRQHQPEFIKLLVQNFLKTPAKHHLLLLPIIEAIRIILNDSPKEKEHFQLLIPKLREMTDFKSEAYTIGDEELSLETIRADEPEESKIMPLSNRMTTERGKTTQTLGDMKDMLSFLETSRDQAKSKLTIQRGFHFSIGRRDKYEAQIIKFIRNKKAILHQEVKELLKVLNVVDKYELAEGIRKIFDPRTKIFPGAGSASKETLEILELEKNFQKTLKTKETVKEVIKEKKEKVKKTGPVGPQLPYNIIKPVALRVEDADKIPIPYIGPKRADVKNLELKNLELKDMKMPMTTTLMTAKSVLEHSTLSDFYDPSKSLVYPASFHKSATKQNAMFSTKLSGIAGTQSSVFGEAGKSMMKKVNSEFTKMVLEDNLP